MICLIQLPWHILLNPKGKMWQQNSLLSCFPLQQKFSKIIVKNKCTVLAGFLVKLVRESSFRIAATGLLKYPHKCLCPCLPNCFSKFSIPPIDQHFLLAYNLTACQILRFCWPHVGWFPSITFCSTDQHEYTDYLSVKMPLRFKTLVQTLLWNYWFFCAGLWGLAPDYKSGES